MAESFSNSKISKDVVTHFHVYGYNFIAFMQDIFSFSS